MIDMQSKPLFDYSDYKKYINDRLDCDPMGRGSRSALSKALSCQTAYVSSVLRGNAHFTPEQGEAINSHFAHTETEAEFFLLLLQWQRAGTESLRGRLKRQMERIQADRFDLKKRIGVSSVLNALDQATYYSEWYYAAIHALASIPEFQTVAAMAERLHLNPALVSQTVEFLLETGLLEAFGKGFKVGQTRLHLGAQSPLISKHHSNWRLLAMQRFPQRRASDVHYSSVITVSKRDAVKLKEMLIGVLRSADEVIRDSREETLQCFSLDFFEV
jgi:uncharacterized protein (TIGR02147 family)